MKVIASPQFLRKVKKLHPRDKKKVDSQILKIADNPQIGTEKKGDLFGLFVQKFQLNKLEHLLSYKMDTDSIYLLTIGSHENYYRDLKKYT